MILNVIVDVIVMKVGNVCVFFYKMVIIGEVQKIGCGQYIYLDNMYFVIEGLEKGIFQ